MKNIHSKSRLVVLLFFSNWVFIDFLLRGFDSFILVCMLMNC